MDSFMDFKNLFGCFRQVSAVVTERFLLSQLAKTAQKSSQNPLKINLNSFLVRCEFNKKIRETPINQESDMARNDDVWASSFRLPWHA